MKVSEIMYYIGLFAICVAYVNGFAYDYQVHVAAGKRECFYQPITQQNTGVEVEFQAIDNVPVNFLVKGPRGKLLVNDVRMPTNVHELTLDHVGIYELCIHNIYSNGARIVYLGIFSDSPDKTWPFNQIDEKLSDSQEAEIELEISVTVIHDTFDNMTMSIDKMRFLQQSIRMSNVKDFVVQRQNLSRVTWFSATQSVIMILTGITQVVVIRKLFSENKPTNMKMST